MAASAVAVNGKEVDASVRTDIALPPRPSIGLGEPWLTLSGRGPWGPRIDSPLTNDPRFSL